ncbi:hypothetical protein Q5M85_03190 [Paraclostridium bifermentans]|nr:hypothetical protein [Paraclostridium bifermentans]
MHKMDIKNLDRNLCIEQLVRQIIQEKINGSENSVDFLKRDKKR